MPCTYSSRKRAGRLWAFPAHPRPSFCCAVKTWMPGTRPQVSGTIHASCGLVHGGAGPSISTPPRCACCFWLEVEGGLLRLWRWLGVEKLSNRSAEHQVCPDKPCEGERAGHDFAGVVSQPQ